MFSPQKHLGEETHNQCSSETADLLRTVTVTVIQ